MENLNERTEAQSREPSRLALCEPYVFEARLQAALAANHEKAPHVLVGIEVDHGDEMGTVGGASARAALTERVQAQIDELVSPDTLTLHRRVASFALLLENVPCEDATALAQRVHDAIERSVYEWDGHPVHVPVHIGVLELGPQPALPAPWLARMDEVTRTAAELGGNGVYLLNYQQGALAHMAEELDWHEHITEVLA